ncbi:MAG: hypothetical protein ACXWBL_17435 [Usitatibacter sp.]
MQPSREGIVMRGISGRRDGAGLFMEQLSERLTGEIISVVLLDALARQRESLPCDDFPLATIDLVRAQELSHVRLLERSIRILGGAPARPSPGARRLAQSAECLPRIVYTRCDFADSLDAILVSALREAQGWEELVPLAESFVGFLAWEFRGALLEKRDHLRLFREWLDRLQSAPLRVTA